MSSSPDSQHLVSIPGLGKTSANALHACGIADVLALANADAAALHACLEAAHANISLPRLQSWMEHAVTQSAPSGPLKQTAQYTQAVQAYQQGDWAQSRALIEGLARYYPDDAEITRFLNEIALHQDVESDTAIAPEPGWRQIWDRFGWAGFGALAFLVLLAVGVFGIGGFVREQRAQQAAVATQAMLGELANLENNALAFLNNSRPEDAMTLIEEIQRRDPSYPGIDALLQRAVDQMELDVLYENALVLIAQGRYELALENFETIAARDATFRDIQNQIASTRRLADLQGLIDDADAHFDDGEWAEAIEGYEAILNANLPDAYDTTPIEDSLYTSYLSVISATLNDDALTLEAIDEAEAYYQLALALKPQDAQSVQERTALRNALRQLTAERFLLRAEQALREDPDSREAISNAEFYVQQAESQNPTAAGTLERIELIKGYIEAYSNFSQGLYAAAVPALERIVDAGGALSSDLVTFMLYEGYIAQGNDSLARGHYSEALGSYQLASAVASEFTDVPVRELYAAVKVADTLGKLGDYDVATARMQEIVDAYNLDQRGENPDAPLETLVFAAQAAERGDMRTAFLFYSEAFRELHLLLPNDAIFVNAGASLVNLAFQEGSTIDLLVAANDLTNIGTIGADKEVLIPYYIQP